MDPPSVSLDHGREKKRHETHRRITEAALRLFVAHGYDATTLDAIAGEAAIARRTFFHYFRSKEDIILAWQSALPDGLRDAILGQADAVSALAAVEQGVLKLAADMQPDVAVMIGGIVRSNAQLRASNQAKFVNMEQAAFEALCTLWPDDMRRPEWRITAMIGVGTMRLAIDDWSAAGGKRPLTSYLTDMFAHMPRTLRAMPD